MQTKYSKEITDEFLELYRKLESIEKDDFNRFKAFKERYESSFDSFRAIRNNLTHNIIDSGYPVIVSQNVLIELKNILSLIETKALEKALVGEKIRYATLNTPFLKVLKIMSKNNFSHLPIFNKNKEAIGVISEAAIIDIFAQGLETDNKLVSHFINFFSLKDNQNERYQFISKDEYLSTARKYFENRYKGELRLGLIFITETGNVNEEVLGIISAIRALSV